MDLHRAGKVPDWELVDPSQWNEYQQRAAATNGWDTPGNRETLKGGAEVTLGLICVARGETLLGTLLVGHGRYRDIKDGKIAQATGTKGPKGEMLDATIDTIIMFGALPVLAKRHILSPIETTALTALHSTKSAFTLIAKAKENEIHPPRSAKMGALFQWVGIGVKSLAEVARQHGADRVGAPLDLMGNGAMGVGLILGAIGVRQYAQAAFPVGPEQSIELAE